MVVSVKTETITLFKPPETKLDASSIEKQAHYLAHLILNRDGSIWESQNASLAEWVAPCFRIPLGSFLKQAKNQMISEGKSFEWKLKDSAIQLRPDNQAKVYINGDLYVYISSHNGGKQLVEKKEKTYLMDFSLVNGKPMLESFREEGGGNA